jgi:hypothetical protein
MWQIRPPTQPQLASRSEVLALQMDVERAGLAWACPFSSAAEFEAAVIRSRRRAGAYRPVRLRRYAVYAAVLAAAAALTAIPYLLI